MGIDYNELCDKSLLMLEQTEKSAKNIRYLINGFWPDNQGKFFTGEEKIRASKLDIKRLTNAYDELEGLKQRIREVQIHLDRNINDSQLETIPNEVRDNPASHAKELILKTNIMMEQLEKFNLPDKIYMNN